MSVSPLLCLVIGCGSIGERHVRTFLATGRTRIVACDPRSEIGARMQETYGVAVTANWQEAVPTPLCSLEEGIQTLRFNLAALQSAQENRPIVP